MAPGTLVSVASGEHGGRLAIVVNMDRTVDAEGVPLPEPALGHVWVMLTRDCKLTQVKTDEIKVSDMI